MLSVRKARWPLLVALAVVCLFAFKLFEPGIVWFWGWQPMPSGPYPITSTYDQGWKETGKHADDWLRQARSALQAPALSAAVSVDGKRVWAGAVGYADVANRVPATLKTVFRLGSSSKPVTSVAMGILIDKGAVDLDLPVSHYIPGLGKPLATVTTREAMSHTAGVRDYGLCFCFPIWEFLSRKHYDGPQRDVLRHYEHSQLLFKPGTGFHYSSYGYNLAGAVIEGASGQRFADYLGTEVFVPLGMQSSHVSTGRHEAGDAVFYSVERGRFKTAFWVDDTDKLPSGGLRSTPTDMTRLGEQMLAPTLFGTKTRDLLMRPVPLSGGRPNPQGYALGWRYLPSFKIFKDRPPTAILHHLGTAQGSTSFFMIFPKYRMVVSMIMNRNNGNLFWSEGADLAELFAAQIQSRSTMDVGGR